MKKYILFVLIGFIWSCSHGFCSQKTSAIPPLELEKAKEPLKLRLAFYDPVEDHTPHSRDRFPGYYRGSSSEIKYNYFVISGTQTMAEFIQESYGHDLSINPGASYEEYPLILSWKGLHQNKSSIHVASLMIPRPEALEKDSTLEMTLLISGYVKEIDSIPFTQGKDGVSSPREFARKSPRRKDLSPRFIEALEKNCVLRAYASKNEQFKIEAQKLYIYVGLILNELKRLYQLKETGVKIHYVDEKLTGNFVLYQHKLGEIVKRFGPVELTTELSRDISLRAGMKLTSPRKMNEKSKTIKKKKRKKRIKVKKKRAKTTPPKVIPVVEGSIHKTEILEEEKEVTKQTVPVKKKKKKKRVKKASKKKSESERAEAPIDIVSHHQVQKSQKDEVEVIYSGNPVVKKKKKKRVKRKTSTAKKLPPVIHINPESPSGDDLLK